MELEAKLESNGIVKSGSHINHLLIKMKTPPANTDQQRQPLVIGLVIDKSWSMKGDKIESTIEAACSLVNWLTRNDYICVIAYSADVQIVQPLTQLKDKLSVIDKIKAIQVGTSTNLSGGWLQALKIIESSQIPNAYKRIILLTDGQATIGIKEPSQFNQIAKDHSGRGISTTTIGFGADFNESSLRDIALSGGGNFYFVSSPEEASGIFFREFGDIGSLYAQAVEVKLRLTPGVRMLEMFNDHPVDVNDDGTVNIQAGDIRSDDLRSIVISLEVNSDINPDLNNFIDVNLSYYNLMDNMKLNTATKKITAQYVDREILPDNEVVIERLIYSSAKTLIKVARLLGDGETDTARTLLTTAIDRLEDNLKLSPEQLNPVLTRLKNMTLKLKENASLAGKHIMAMGTDIYSRVEIIDSGVETHDKIFEYKINGDIDLYRCPDIKAVVQAQMKDGYKFIIFDLIDTRFIDSSGIGTFIQISSWLRRRGGEFIVVNIVDTVKKVFEVTRLENHIRVASSISEARDIIETIIISLRR
ncbi:MAG: anti-sigma factor antagonist [Leptospiraceae bacterium]|nr:anti-sigma factor antagonist [Leptospiraceae bacterium]